MIREEESHEWSLCAVFYPDLFPKDEVGLKYLRMTTENCRKFQRQSQELKSTSDDSNNWFDLAEPCDRHDKSNSQKLFCLFTIVHIHSGLVMIRGDSCGLATAHPPQGHFLLRDYEQLIEERVNLWRTLPGYDEWVEGGLAGHRKWLENLEESKPKECLHDAW
ncbi:hypothetical protein BELL_0101g00100 [Botrytis elliptica]|uniref:Uncharacterized protein n=1 Tax=Botrytis elliptica TaxID=278938 RepID=A0A4Z1JV82_9HELO|nr:hypothetical protein BELL_0101g00100 [Botrytis elliptica]